MTSQIAPALHTIPPELAGLDAILPAMIRQADERIYWRFIGFFAESIRNRRYDCKHLPEIEPILG